MNSWDDEAPKSPEVAPLTNRKATEVFVALSYWARATRFQPNEAESAVLSTGEERSNQRWGLGLIIGGNAGFLLGLRMKLPVTQRVGIGLATGTVCGMYGQFVSNAPCLAELRAMGRAAAAAGEPSVLAEQAEHILKVGGPATIKAVQHKLMADSAERTPQSAPADPRSHMPPSRLSPQGRQYLQQPAANEEPRDLLEADAWEEEEKPPASAAARVGAAAVAGGGWDQVRARYRERSGEIQSGEVARSANARARSFEASQANKTVPLSDGVVPKHVPKNVYGDAIYDER